MALLPLGVVGIPTFEGASWPAKLDAFQVCSGNALCLCLRLGIDLELCSKREHSEDDIGDDAAKQVLILGGVEDGGVQNNDINTKSLCEKLPFRADGRVRCWRFIFVCRVKTEISKQMH